MSTEPVRLGKPGPWRITFDTNPDDCNLACVMCEEHSEFSSRKRLRLATHSAHRVMDEATIRKVVTEMAPLGLREIIPSTMGEPLLYPGMEAMVGLCREFGIRLNLTTNGTWPKRGPVGWASLLCPVTSDVKVSWNGTSAATQEGIMVGTRLQVRVDRLREFIRARDHIARDTGVYCSVTLQCTFMDANLAELPGLVRFAAEIGADRVKGHHLWVHFKELSEQDLRRSTDSRRRWNVVARRCRQEAMGHPREDGRSVRLENFLELPEDGTSATPDEWGCPFLGLEAWVNHSGRFDPCCAADAERRSLGYFGSVLDSGMRSIWDGPEYQALVEGFRSKAVCKDCTMRRPALTE